MSCLGIKISHRNISFTRTMMPNGTFTIFIKEKVKTLLAAGCYCLFVLMVLLGVQGDV